MLTVGRSTKHVHGWGYNLAYSGKLSREKTFMNFADLEPPAKVFSAKFGHAVHTYDRF